MSSPTPAPTSTDPQPRRIIDATLKVIVDRGVSGLTHRLVAGEADVPLSATTYYFGTREELIEAAFSETVARDLSALRERLEEMPADADLAHRLAVVIHERIGQEWTGVLVAELMVAALRSERLRALVVEWDNSWQKMLLSDLDDVSAKRIGAVMHGLIQGGVMSRPAMTLEELADLLRPVIELAP